MNLQSIEFKGKNPYLYFKKLTQYFKRNDVLLTSGSHTPSVYKFMQWSCNYPTTIHAIFNNIN